MKSHFRIEQLKIALGFVMNTRLYDFPMKQTLRLILTLILSSLTLSAQNLIWKPVAVSGFPKGEEMIFEYVADKVYQKDHLVGYLTTLCTVQNVPELASPSTTQKFYLTFVHQDDSTQVRDVRLTKDDLQQILKDSSLVWKMFFDKATTGKDYTPSRGYWKVIAPKLISNTSIDNMFVPNKPNQLDTSKGIWIFGFTTDYGFQSRFGLSINVYWDANSLRVNGNTLGFSYLLEFLDGKRPVMWQQAIVLDSGLAHYTKGVKEIVFEAPNARKLEFSTAQQAISQQRLWYQGAIKKYLRYWDVYHTSKELQYEPLKPNEQIQDFILVQLRYVLRAKMEKMMSEERKTHKN